MSSLTPEAICSAAGTRWAGRAVHHAQQMDSTNARAKELAHAGAPNGTLVVCEHQTAGRGRMQRVWQTPAGEALTFTLIVRPKLPPAQAQLCTFAAALAAAQAVAEVCPQLQPRLKWPNDVVIGGKKCVGILSEMALEDDELAFVAVGVGVNVNQTAFAPELEATATSLLLECRKEDAGMQRISRGKVLCAFLRYMERAVETLERQGLAGILPDYLALSATVGSRVRVIGTAEQFVGTAVGMDDTGALIVTDEDGAQRRVLSGDVSVRGLMGYC